MSEIAEIYSISGSAIEDINKGRRWTSEKEIYPIRPDAKKIARRGQNQNGSIFTKEDVLIIRNRFVEEDIKMIFEDYKDKIAFSGFKKVVYGVT